MPTEWPEHPADAENRRHRAQVEKTCRERIESAVEQAIESGTLTPSNIRFIVNQTIEQYAGEV